MTRLPWKAVLLICFRYKERQNNCQVSKLETCSYWRYKGIFVTRKVSGRSRNGPLVYIEAKQKVCACSFVGQRNHQVSCRSVEFLLSFFLDVHFCFLFCFGTKYLTTLNTSGGQTNDAKKTHLSRSFSEILAPPYKTERILSEESVSFIAVIGKQLDALMKSQPLGWDWGSVAVENWNSKNWHQTPW